MICISSELIEQMKALAMASSLSVEQQETANVAAANLQAVRDLFTRLAVSYEQSEQTRHTLMAMTGRMPWELVAMPSEPADVVEPLRPVFSQSALPGGTVLESRRLLSQWRNTLRERLTQYARMARQQLICVSGDEDGGAVLEALEVEGLLSSEERQLVRQLMPDCSWVMPLVNSALELTAPAA